MKTWYQRLRLFFGVVWRPCTGPSNGERWSAWTWFQMRIRIAHAWELARAMHP